MSSHSPLSFHPLLKQQIRQAMREDGSIDYGALLALISGHYAENEIKNRMDYILDYISEGIYGLDLEGQTTFGNQAAVSMLGYTLEEMLHKPQHDLIHHHYPDGTLYPRERCNIYHAFKDGKVHKEEGEVFWRKDGSSFPVEYNSSPVRDENGEITGAVVVFRDITERKRAELKLHDYAMQMEVKNMELAAAKDLAEQANRHKSQFLANMSHEIRTPMNGVIGMTNLLLDCDLGPVERGYAQTVLHSADALLQIINDILDFSKIEAGKIDLEFISFDLQLLCEEICEMVALKSAEKKVELLLRYPAGTARYVAGDPGRVRQILFNLLNNALKFTDYGHVLLSLQSAPAENGKIKFHVEVEDTGIGIQPDKTDYIFNKFTQADSSTSRKFGGTGLGLSICRELVRMMGGEIGVRSTYGVGSVFWFDILLEEDKAGEDSLLLPQNDGLKDTRVLVVDDNEAARVIIREQLAPCGAVVTEASGGEEALALLEKDIFDIAVIDFMMPHMDGAELGRRIKANPRTASLALLMITSAPNRGDKKWLEDIGFAGYLGKPLLRGQLRDTLAVIHAAQRAHKPIQMITQHNLKEARAGRQEKLEGRLQFQNAHILLAEDNPVNQMVAVAMLEKYGCRITPAGDGDEAVKQLKQRAFDLVFMDCQMPVMDGYEATRIIRKLEEHQKRPRTPIIAFTAYALKGDSDKCAAAGMDDYITKPLRQGDLERVLTDWMPKEKRSDGEPPPPTWEKSQTYSVTFPVLDEERFSLFADLMDESLAPILGRHFKIADECVRNVSAAAAAQDLAALRELVHPLKSSSQQIGALRVADLAEKIERFAAHPDASQATLSSLAAQLTEAQREAEAELKARLK